MDGRKNKRGGHARRSLPGCHELLRCVVLLVAAWAVRAEDAEAKIYFEDVTGRSNLKLERVVSTEKRYIIETMAGGVAFIDYDRDGWLDVYLTNCPTIQSFKSGRLPANRLYRNNHDGTFTDVSEKAGVAFRGWCLGVSVGDYNSDGYPDIYLSNFGPNVLYRNNGDGTYTDVTVQAGVGDACWSASSGWADYDADGRLDLFVANYLDYDLDQLPEFGRGRYCLFRSLEVLCGPRGMKGAGDALYHNNGDGTFTDVSKKPAWMTSVELTGSGSRGETLTTTAARIYTSPMTRRPTTCT